MVDFATEGDLRFHYNVDIKVINNQTLTKSHTRKHSNSILILEHIATKSSFVLKDGKGV